MKEINVETLRNTVTQLRHTLTEASNALSSEPRLRSDVILGEALQKLNLIEQTIQQYQANNNHEILFKQLKELLQTRSKVTKDTYLNYSLHLESPITHFFMDLAITLHDVDPTVSLEEYLMPGSKQELQLKSERPLEKLLREANAAGNQRQDNLLSLVDDELKETVISHMSNNVEYFTNVLEAYGEQGNLLTEEEFCNSLQAKNKDGDNPLLYAIKNNLNQATQTILSHALEEDLQVKDKDGRTPLMVDLQDPKWTVGEKILEKSERPLELLRQTDNFKNTVLHLAVGNAHRIAVNAIVKNIVSCLLLVGELRKENSEGKTPLELAYIANDENEKKVKGKIALQLILRTFKQRTFSVEIFERCGEDAYNTPHLVGNAKTMISRIVDDKGNTALMHAIKTHQFKAAAVIINHLDVAEFTNGNSDGDTALHLAVDQQHLKIVKRILKKLNDWYYPNHQEETPLTRVALVGNRAIADAILAKVPADSLVWYIEVKDKSGKNCLLHACENGHFDFVTHILRKYQAAGLLLEKNDDKTLFSFILEQQGEQANLLSLLSIKNKDNVILLTLANCPEYADIITEIRARLTEDYLVSYPNPLIKMTMRFVKKQVLEGSRNEQLEHFLTLIKRFKLECNNSVDMDRVRGECSFKQKTSSKFLGNAELYVGLMKELNRIPHDKLPALLVEFMDFIKIIKEILAFNTTVKNKDDKILIEGAFNTMANRYRDITSQVENATQIRRPAITLDGGPS